MDSSFNREELKATLQDNIRINKEGVILLALRCALRVIPLTSKDGKFIFESSHRRNALAIWRVNYLGFHALFDSSVVESAYRAAIKQDSVGAEKGSFIQSDKVLDKVIYIICSATLASSYHEMNSLSRIVSKDNKFLSESMSIDAILFAYDFVMGIPDLRSGFLDDIHKLKSKNLDEETPFWHASNTTVVESFYEACNRYELSVLVKDYQSLVTGGHSARTYFMQSSKKYEALWEKLSSEKDYAEGEIEPNNLNEEINESSTEIINKYIPNTQYLADDTSADDHLNRQNLVSAVASWLSDRKNKQHIALGLFGEWGAGKSTFIEHLKKGCKDSESVQCIWGEFNAWQYEHTENIQAGIAQEAITALKRDLNFVEQLRLTIEYAKERNPFWYWVFVAFGLLFNVIIYLNLVLSNFFEFDDANNLFEYVFGTTLFLTVASGFKSYHKIYPQALANKVKTYLRLPDFGKHLGTIPVMREQLGSLIKVRLKKSVPVTHSLSKKIRPERGEIIDKRFMFVVDDLDRCSHDGVVKTLEAVRLVMNTPNVVVIIAVDQRIALASLALHYEQLSRHHGADPLTIARDYLGKVVNMPITLDKPDKSEITGYLDYLWAKNKSHPLDSNAVVDLDVLKQRQASEQTQLTNTEVHDESDSGLSKKEDTDVTTAKNPALESDSVEVRFDVHGASVTSVRETIEDLSDAQKATFKYWIGILNFSNPRQIKRLNNAYALIRLCHKDEDHVRRKLFPRMVMMFWLEYLNESHSHNLRCRIIHQLESSEDSNEEIVFKDRIDEQQAKAVWDQVADYILQDTSKWSNVYRQVKGFVLPAIEQLNGEDLAPNNKPEIIKEMA